MILNIIVLTIFVVIMIATGIIYSKKPKTVNDFFLGGRNAGGILSAFAYGTTYFSAVMFTLCGSLGMKNGISVMWIGIGNALIGGLLAWLVLAKRTRKFSEELGALTMMQLLERRFDSKFLSSFISIVVFIFLVPYTASVYNGLGLIFEASFGINFIYCAIILAVTTAIYVYLGGYKATMANSLIQGVITVVSVVAFYFVFFRNANIGGLVNGLKSLGEIDPALVSPLGPSPIFIIATVIITSFGSWGLPQMAHKFFSVKESEVNKGAICSTLFCLVIAGGMYFLGGFSKLFFLNSGTAIPEVTDKIMPILLTQSTTGLLFSVLFVMLLASSMSTLSSLVLVSSSTFTEDILKGIFNVELEESKNLALMRVMCIAFVIISVLLAIVPNKIIVLLSLSWGGIASTCMAPYIYALYTKNPRKWIALVSSIMGFATMMVGVSLFGKENSTYIGCIALALSFASLGISLFVSKIKNNKQITLS